LAKYKNCKKEIQSFTDRKGRRSSAASAASAALLPLLPGCHAAWLPGCLAAWLPGCLAALLPCSPVLEVYLLSTGDLQFLPDLSTFYGRKVGKFTAVNRPIYGGLFTGSRYKKRRKFWCIMIKICKTQ
jgi:hypothetical protein